MKFLFTIIPSPLSNDGFPILSEPDSLFGSHKKPENHSDALRLTPCLGRLDLADTVWRIGLNVRTAMDLADRHTFTLREDPTFFEEFLKLHHDHYHEHAILAEEQEASVFLAPRQM